jgi:hypothetical protein
MKLSSMPLHLLIQFIVKNNGFVHNFYFNITNLSQVLKQNLLFHQRVNVHLFRPQARIEITPRCPL